MAAPLRGLDLKLARIAAGVMARDIAVEAGVSRQRIGQIEAAQRPGARAVARYLDALTKLIPAR